MLKAMKYVTMRDIDPTQFVEALAVPALPTTMITVTFASAADRVDSANIPVKVHKIALYNNGNAGCYFTLSTPERPVSGTTAAAAFAAAASSGLSSRGYLPAGGAIELTLTSPIKVLYLSCAETGKTTDIYGVVGEA